MVESVVILILQNNSPHAKGKYLLPKANSVIIIIRIFSGEKLVREEELI